MRQYLLMNMGFLSRRHRQLTNEAFVAAGIGRSQPWILDYLAENDGCIQRELSEHSHFDPATITAAMVRMEEQELVHREAVPGDKRALRVYLTEKGREKQRYVQEVFAKTEERALQGFTQEERVQLERYLYRIHKNMEKDGEV